MHWTLRLPWLMLAAVAVQAALYLPHLPPWVTVGIGGGALRWPKIWVALLPCSAAALWLLLAAAAETLWFRAVKDRAARLLILAWSSVLSAAGTGVFLVVNWYWFTPYLAPRQVVNLDLAWLGAFLALLAFSLAWPRQPQPEPAMAAVMAASAGVLAAAFLLPPGWVLALAIFVLGLAWSLSVGLRI